MNRPRECSGTRAPLASLRGVAGLEWLLQRATPPVKTCAGLLAAAGTKLCCCIAFASFILAQDLGGAEDALPRTGVTVLVHGLVVFDGTTKKPLEYWGGQNIANLLDRFGSGVVWLYKPATRTFDNITHQRDPDDGTYVIPRGVWQPAFAGQQILLFDWTAASGEAESGQAEAAADELFAALLAFEVDGEPIIFLSPPEAQAVRPLHFIGHSRGTVVASETIQRLGRYNVPVSYATYLDPHDFGQPGIPSDEYFHDPAVQVWHNVDHADAAFQLSPSTVCGINPAGRRLAHIPMGARQRDLTNLALFDTCFEGISPHARVKDYYWATVARNAGSEDGPPRSWFGGGDGSGYGFDRWFANGGYDQPRDETLTRIDAGTPGVALSFHWGGDVANDRGFPDRNNVPPVLFNGEFDLPDLDGGIGATQANSLAGWWYYGGGGSATVRRSGGNHFLELLRGDLQSTPVEAVHNRFYLPKTATEIRFAYWGVFVPPLGTHTLEVLIGNRLLRRFTAAGTNGFEVRTVSLAGHSDLLGRANTLTFRLNTNNPPRASAQLALDNISIFEGNSAAKVISFKKTGNGEFKLDWQSWPPKRYRLETQQNGLNGLWQTIEPPLEAASAGSITIEYPGVPSAFFRLRPLP